MASFGKLNTSAASLSIEPTIALANFNFDFSIMKLPAPREFADVGRHLSSTRRDEAEGGTAHTVARKLGALFKGALPPTPELIKAYGARASQIARTTAMKNQEENSSYGFFAKSVGADATSLWAAATSGKASIACHLLACMLARIWEPPEATSIWDEIVSKRKQEIEFKFEEDQEQEMELMVAARQALQRSDLADWDASARAWLQIADSVMSREQTQVRLIFDNLPIPVNEKPETYSSVIQAWSSAMLQMEQLLQGNPIRVRSGDIILGITSWHLYPEMTCISSSVKKVKLYHPLFEKCGLLTVGLENRSVDHKSVYWSLPLAHLRYYGLPVSKSRSIALSERGKLTLDEFLWVLTAAYIRQWDNNVVPTEDVVGFVEMVAHQLHLQLTLNKDGSQEATTSWLSLISATCKSYLSTTDSAKKDAQRLRNLGRMYCKVFDADFHPFQRIFSVSTFLTVGSAIDDKILLLRRLAAKIMPARTSYEFIIRYKVEDPQGQHFKFTTATLEHFLDYQINDDMFIPVDRNTPRIYHSWIETTKGHRSGFTDGNICPFRLQPVYGDVDNVALFRRKPNLRKSKAEQSDEYTRISYENYFSIDMIMEFFQPNKINFAALAKELKRGKVGNESVIAMTLISNIYRGMNGAVIDVRAVQCDFASSHWVKNACYLSRYKGRNLFSLDLKDMDEKTAFSCIAMMETGSFDIMPKDLQNVMALSSLDSLFIVSALLRDPSNICEGGSITRVTGNIGKAGLAFLVPPLEPMIKSFGINEWYSVEHKYFNGSMEDCFASTSLHLSFSEAKLPLNLGFSGGRDVEAYLVEAIISVYDKSSWIADLDVLAALNSPKLDKKYLNLSLQGLCGASGTCSMVNALNADGRNEIQIDQQLLIAVDNYAEMIITPSSCGIIRARYNWEARLAAVSICLAKGHKVVLKPENVCLACLGKAFPAIVSELKSNSINFLL